MYPITALLPEIHTIVWVGGTGVVALLVLMPALLRKPSHSLPIPKTRKGYIVIDAAEPFSVNRRCPRTLQPSSLPFLKTRLRITRRLSSPARIWVRRARASQPIRKAWNGFLAACLRGPRIQMRRHCRFQVRGNCAIWSSWRWSRSDTVSTPRF